MKRYFGIIGLCLAMFILGFIFSDLISLPTKDGQIGESLEETADDLFTMEDTIEAVVTETDDLNDTTDAEETDSENKYTPDLLHNKAGFNNSYFYVYSLRPRAYDDELSDCISWDFVASEDKEHNEWIETQTFTSLFRYREKCIRAGYVKETGQWGIMDFYYHGLYTAYVGMGQSIGTTITYSSGDYWLVTPDAFGIPNDHRVEITSFDESKQTVTLTFTSPEGESTEVYINYEKRCRCDEDGTPLLDEDGNTFLYQFD